MDRNTHVNSLYVGNRAIPSTKSLALDLLSSTPQAYSHSSSGLHSLIRRMHIFPSFSKVCLDRDKENHLNQRWFESSVLIYFYRA